MAAITATSPYLTTINRNSIILMHPAFKDLTDEPVPRPLEVFVPSAIFGRPSNKGRAGIYDATAKREQVQGGDFDAANPNPDSTVTCQIAMATRRRLGVCEKLEQSTIDNLTDIYLKSGGKGIFEEEPKEIILPNSRKFLTQSPCDLEEDTRMSRIKKFLLDADDWDFDIFGLSEVTNGQPLLYLGIHLFEVHDLIKKLDLDWTKMVDFLTELENSYRKENCYHNSLHAADVTQAIHCLLIDPKIYPFLTNAEIFAVILGALCHDCDHPGVNQNYLIKTKNPLADQHGDKSTLEKHHLFASKLLLKKTGLLEDSKEKADIINFMDELIIATDVSRHKDYLNTFKSMVQGSIDLKVMSVRRFVLTILMKIADISNPARPLNLSKRWSYLIMEEFFLQGDKEKQKELPVSFLCDRESTSIPQSQINFFNFCTLPLFEALNSFNPCPLAGAMCTNISNNIKYWNGMLNVPKDELPPPPQSPLLQIGHASQPKSVPLSSRRLAPLGEGASSQSGFLPVQAVLPPIAKDKKDGDC